MSGIPSTAKEIKFIAYFESGTPIIFENEFLYTTFTSTVRNFEIGGYYASSSNYATCYVGASLTTATVYALGSIASLAKSLVIYYR